MSRKYCRKMVGQWQPTASNPGLSNHQCSCSKYPGSNGSSFSGTDFGGTNINSVNLSNCPLFSQHGLPWDDYAYKYNKHGSYSDKDK
jgi:hypothetical protein